MTYRREVEEEKETEEMFKIKIPNRHDSSDWRLIFGNINTLGDYNNNYNSVKWDKFKYLYDETTPDIIGLSEHNRAINNMKRENKPNEVIGKWHIRTVCRFAWLNDEKNKTSYELGGTGIVTSGKGSTHTIGSGDDEERMGRWNWITIQGKRDRITTIISIYRPGQYQAILDRQQAMTSAKRPNTAMRLHPQEVWDNDLNVLLEGFLNKGHELIVAGDWNQDLNSSDSSVREYMGKKGLVEAITQRYGSGPETYHKGTTTIDGIFMTPGLSMKQGGYTSHEISPGDHRWIWMDIGESIMTGRNRDDYAPPVERRVTSKIPSVRDKFNSHLESQVLLHKLHEKMDNLYTSASQKKKLTNDEEEVYELIENRMRRAIKYSDKKCRKVRRGKIPFSKTAQTIMRKLRILKLILRRDQLKGSKKRPQMRKLRRLANKYQYDGPLTFNTRQEIVDALSTAKKEYNEFKPKAHELRESYLFSIASELADEDPKGRSVQQHHSKLIREESTKQHFKHIKFYERKSNRRGVDKVDVQESDGGWHTVHNKDDIVRHIKIANKEKRQQARHTPCRMEPLATLLGEQMDYDKWEKILAGSIHLPNEGIEEGTRLWYNMMQSKITDEIDLTWTTEEYCASWKQMCETKSSIPGVHAAHMKCLNPTSKAAEVMSKLAMIPLLTGYAPTTWKMGIDSMIPKKIKGECRPDKLRLILLFDARFNHNNKLIGKKMMEYGEKHNILAKEQFGSRKNKSAIEHAINKRLTLDISRQTRSTCIYIANDAKSCYDRILLMVAYLSMRNAGVSATGAISSIRTLVEMKISIKTAHGVSADSYGGTDWDKWPHGIGQGNGYGPAIWALISSPLLTIMRQQGYGTHIHSPLTKEELKMSGFSFVDDTDQCEMVMKNRDWQEHKRATQDSLTLWESLLRTTGGAIEPTKSDWTKLKYKWMKGKSLMEKADKRDKLFMRNPNGEIKELVQKEPTDARETLGVWQTATGCEKTQVAQLQSKIKKWGTNISKSGINKSETATAVRITIGKTIRYPLGATTIGSKEAKRINKEFRWAALGKMGVVRTASGSVTAAPVIYGGLGMANEVYENQMIDHTLAIMGHGHTKSTTGVLIRTSLECLAIEAGIGGDPGSFDIKNMHWVTENTWIGSTLKAYGEYDIELETSVKGLKTWTSRDEYIMERAYDTAMGNDVHIFNKVRMYLKVATISDLLTADGKEVDQNILQCKSSNSPTMSEYAYTWPNVPPPTKFEALIWYNTISTILAITQSNSRIYGNTIFKWDRKEVGLAKWTVSVGDEAVYERKDNEWNIWRKQEGQCTRRKGSAYRLNGTTKTIDPSVLPITVTDETEGKRYIISRGEVIDFEDMECQTTEGWVLPLLVSDRDSEETFAQELIRGKATMVCDGSYKDGRSSAAFTTVPAKEITGSVTIPGKYSDHSSYRAELGGILASATFANLVAQKFHITEGQCTIVCDNKGALSASFGHKHINPRWQCYDLLCMIRYQIMNSPLQWKHRHIKGHQDTNIPYDQLSIMAQANVDVDHLAKEEWSRNRHVSDDTVLPGQCWRLKHVNSEGYIQGNIEQELRSIFYEEKMRNIWKEKFRLDRRINQEEWELMKRVNKSRLEWEHLFAVKYAYGLLPTKVNMVRRKHDHDDRCPCCDEREDINHILRCPSESQEAKFQEELGNLKRDIMNITSWDISGGIIELIEAFRGDRLLVPHHNWSSAVIEAVTMQYELGQRAFTSGLWIKQWTEVQQVFHKTQKTRKKGTTIVALLIKKIQTMIREMWYGRNNQMHNNEQSRTNKERVETTNSKIEQIYERKKVIPLGLLAPGDRKYFRSPIQKIRRMRIMHKERWVRDAEMILKKYDNENNTEQRRRFRSYFMHRDDG